MIQSNPDTISILVADDDPDDRLFTKEAFAENKLSNKIYFVEDGEALIRFLRQEDEYANMPRPGLILLDLNMPRLCGREALKILKNDDDLRMIPVIVLTTSKAEEDIVKSYNLGVNSFISKPVTFQQLVDVIGKIGQYWFGIVKLPKNLNDRLING